MAYSMFGINLLESIFNLTLECDPTMADRHINFVSWNPGIPSKGIEYGSGKIRVGAFGRVGEVNLEVINYCLDTTNAVSGLLSSPLFHKGIDPASQGDDPILDRDPNLVGLNALIPLQFIQDISLDLFVATNGSRCCHDVSFLSQLCSFDACFCQAHCLTISLPHQ